MKKQFLYIFLVLMFCNTSQALPKCEGRDYALWINCKGTYLDKDITRPDNAGKFKVTRDFTGEFGSVPGQRQGKGFSKVYKDGSLIVTYFGELKDDKPQGQGTKIITNGDKYVGEWKDGKTHGQGTLTGADGSKYVGEWKDGKKHGQGTCTYANGHKYVGEWSDGLFNGQGTYTWSDGRKYVGEWKDDKQQGQGTFTGADGIVKQKGIWKNGKLDEAN